MPVAGLRAWMVHAWTWPAWAVSAWRFLACMVSMQVHARTCTVECVGVDEWRVLEPGHGVDARDRPHHVLAPRDEGRLRVLRRDITDGEWKCRRVDLLEIGSLVPFWIFRSIRLATRLELAPRRCLVLQNVCGFVTH
eukprot:365094-Chlamydomonas_euryale.AAC.4